MKIQALWVIADDTFEEGIAILGGSKARLHLLACNISILSAMQSAALLVLRSPHCPGAVGAKQFTSPYSSID